MTDTPDFKPRHYGNKKMKFNVVDETMERRIGRGVVLSAALVALGACSTLPNGTDQTMTVMTSPPMSAHCLLSNERGAWSTYTTPENVSILRGARPLVVSCESSDGARGQAAVASRFSLGADLAGAGQGTLQTGGNAAPPLVPYQANTTNDYNGAAGSYPSAVVVPMILPVAATGPVTVIAGPTAPYKTRPHGIRHHRALRHRVRHKAVHHS